VKLQWNDKIWTEFFILNVKTCIYTSLSAEVLSFTSDCSFRKLAALKIKSLCRNYTFFYVSLKFIPRFFQILKLNITPCCALFIIQLLEDETDSLRRMKRVFTIDISSVVNVVSLTCRCLYQSLVLL
jgi:hypothetical protein